MNICLISQEYPPETNWGGIATYTQVLARQLVKTGQRVHVVTLAEQEEFTADDLGVKVHRVGRVPKRQVDVAMLDAVGWPNHGVLNFSQRVYEKIQEIHESEALDVIEAPETCAQALVTFKYLEGVTKITRLHTPFFWVRHLNNMPDTEDHLLRDQLEKIQTELSSAVTSPTQAMAEVVRSTWGTDKITVIPNFFNLVEYTPDYSIYQQLLNGLDYVLFFGRLEYRKGVHVLAEALPEFFAQHPGVTAVFVGSDSTYNSRSMKSYLVEKLNGYENRTLFIENIPHTSLYPLIDKAKFILLPSLWENFPYACLEAMTLGKTVVASDAGGFPEIIEDGAEGILTPPGDAVALRQALFRCQNELDLAAIGGRARRKAATYETGSVVDRMLEFYRRQQRLLPATPLKVAYVLRHIPVPSETFVINEIIELQNEGVEIHPISLLQAQHCHEDLMSQISQKVIDLSCPDVKATASSSPFFKQASAIASADGISSALAVQAALVADYVKANAIRHLHAHFATESAFVAMIAAKLTEVSSSFTSHAYDIFRTSNTGTLIEDTPTKRLDILLQQTEMALTISDFNKQYLLRQGLSHASEKIEIVRCGIHPERFVFHDRPGRDEITVLCVGRFVEKKGYEYLLRAFRNLSAIFENARLRLIGEGDLKEPMQLLARELGIEDKTDFLGATSSETVLVEMQNADIFALHSITASDGDMEGIPVSLMEASATGLPVLSTIHSGIPELVVDGTTGFLARARDVEEFSNYLIALASSPDLRKRMGAAGRKHVEQHFNLHLEAAKLAGLFQRLAAKEPTSTKTTYADSIDIIMPTYNCDLSLMRRAINSVLAQEYTRWNLFIVKDGGDSDVASLVAEFNDPRIDYEEIPHAGKPTALNHAITKGRSKYIAYLDDDDIWYPSHLQMAVTHMCNNDVSFVHTDAYEVMIRREDGSLTELSRKILSLGALTDTTLISISHINAVHERALLDKAGQYDTTKRFFIDWDMFLRMAKFGFPDHIRAFTCEHYIYVDKDNKQKNTITGIHKNDPELSWKMQIEMYKQALTVLSPDAYVRFISDWLNKTWQITEKEKRISELQELLEKEKKFSGVKSAEFYSSISWKVTKPLRYIYDLFMKLK